MGFDEIFTKQHYFYDYDEKSTSEFIPQKKIYNLLKQQNIIDSLKEENIDLPDISEVTFRKRVRELVLANKIRNQVLRNMVLVNINDIHIIVNYLIEKRDQLNSNKKMNSKRIKKDSICGIVDKVKEAKRENDRLSKELKKLTESAKKGDEESTKILKEKFKCKVFTDEEILKYEKEIANK